MIVNTLLSQALICPPQPPLLHTYQRFSVSLGVNLEILILISWAHTVGFSLLFSLNSLHVPGSSTLHSYCPSQFLRCACSPCHRPSMDCAWETNHFLLLSPWPHSSFSHHPPGKPTMAHTQHNHVCTWSPDFLLALPTVLSLHLLVWPGDYILSLL